MACAAPSSSPLGLPASRRLEPCDEASSEMTDDRRFGQSGGQGPHPLLHGLELPDVRHTPLPVALLELGDHGLLEPPSAPLPLTASTSLSCAESTSARAARSDCSSGRISGVYVREASWAPRGRSRRGTWASSAACNASQVPAMVVVIHHKELVRQGCLSDRRVASKSM